jgi:hypothetical protein
VKEAFELGAATYSVADRFGQFGFARNALELGLPNARTVRPRSGRMSRAALPDGSRVCRRGLALRRAIGRPCAPPSRWRYSTSQQYKLIEVPPEMRPTGRERQDDRCADQAAASPELKRQSVEAAAHVRAAGGKPYPNAARHRDHRPELSSVSASRAISARPRRSRDHLISIRTPPPRGICPPLTKHPAVAQDNLDRRGGHTPFLHRLRIPVIVIGHSGRR